MSENKPDIIPTLAEIKEIVDLCLTRLLHQDRILFTNDVAERSITHKLAEYLQSYFPERNVDCEYNRNGPNTPKRYQGILNEIKTEIQVSEVVGANIENPGESSAYPDIIVHHRGDNEANLLIVEVKKWNSVRNRPRGLSPLSVTSVDYRKLAAFTMQAAESDYRYHYGVFILVDSGHPNVANPQLTWFADGTPL